MNSPTDAMKNPNHNLREQLERIGLHTVAAQLDDMLAHATEQRWSPRQLLEQLAQIEVAERAHRSLERRLRTAEIRRFKPIADFDCNLVLVGANGLGKTMIAQNICHAAVLAGHSVLFRTASALLEELHRQTPEGRLRKLRAYANVALLCIDEVGYLSFDDKSADLLYEVINRRYEQKSLILTTNKPFKEWNEVFPNAACIATLLDRLLHHAEVTVIEGSSYRVRESEQETTARRRRKK
jgi:DNA replication protein DnaC